MNDLETRHAAWDTQCLQLIVIYNDFDLFYGKVKIGRLSVWENCYKVI